MMRWEFYRTLALCLALVLTGCTTKPASATTDTAKTSLFDGVYEFDVEKPTGTPTMLTANRTGNGPGKIEELVDYEIGTHRIKVINGTLSLNGKDYGTLQRGDKVRFTAADGKLFVNGVERAEVAPPR